MIDPEWVPTDDDIKNAYTYDPEYEYHNPVDTGYWRHNLAAYNRWLQAHDAEVAAKAKAEELRAAAASILVDHPIDAEVVRFWLEDRANFYRPEEGE